MKPTPLTDTELHELSEKLQAMAAHFYMYEVLGRAPFPELEMIIRAYETMPPEEFIGAFLMRSMGHLGTYSLKEHVYPAVLPVIAMIAKQREEMGRATAPLIMPGDRRFQS